MKKLAIDMELFIELSSIDTRGEGESYLNTNDGEFSYIPINVLEAINNDQKLQKLEEWEKELLDEAKEVVNNSEGKYLYIPIVTEDFTLEIMKDYVKAMSDNEIKHRLMATLDEQGGHSKFNSILLKDGDIDSFYDYKDYRTYEYLKKWLLLNDIELIEGYK